VPVVGQRERNGVDLLGFKQLAHVGELGCFVALGLFDPGDGALAGGLVDVADRGDAAFFDLAVETHMVVAATPRPTTPI